MEWLISDFDYLGIYRVVGLIFGSIAIILIFSAYHVLFLPMLIMEVYAPFVTDEDNSGIVHVLGLFSQYLLLA